MTREERYPVKKNIDQKKLTLRLTLNRETIKILDNPSRLDLARVHGGQSDSQCVCTTTTGGANTVGCEPTLWTC